MLNVRPRLKPKHDDYKQWWPRKNERGSNVRSRRRMNARGFRRCLRLKNKNV
jgi:hypothetical protein